MMTAAPNDHASAGPAIELRGVQHRYGKQLALEDLSLSLPAGTTICLIGPDGVGKSTLLGLIAGSKRHQHGSIRVLGADLANRREREALLPRLAVGQLAKQCECHGREHEYDRRRPSGPRYAFSTPRRI
jgi:ribosome-dependent ATPase